MLLYLLTVGRAIYIMKVKDEISVSSKVFIDLASDKNNKAA